MGSFRRKIQPVTPRLVRFDSKVEKWLVELFTGIEAGWKIFVIPCFLCFVCFFWFVGCLLDFFSGVSKTFTDLLHKQKQELTSNINVTCGDYLFKTPLTPPPQKKNLFFDAILLEGGVLCQISESDLIQSLNWIYLRKIFVFTRWWFQTFLFLPILVEMIQFDGHIFQTGWLKPPDRSSNWFAAFFTLPLCAPCSLCAL